MSRALSQRPAGRRPSILVVEDDRAVLKMLGALLGQIGHVTLAEDGQDAYEMLEAGLIPDVVVTDLMMPRMDGLTLAKKMKNDRNLGRVPVVMLTAKARPTDVVLGINAGARAYITKPFKHDELLEKVKSALRL